MKTFVSFVILNLFFCSVFGQSEVEFIGTIKTIEVAVCRIDVPSGGKVIKFNHVHEAAEGWQIVSFRPTSIPQNLKASYTFSPKRSQFIRAATSPVHSKFIELFELAAEKNVFQKYEGQITQMRDNYERYYGKQSAAYSKIMTTGSVSPDRQSRSRRFDINLKVTLIYLPRTEEGVLQSLVSFRELINSEE